MARCRKLTGRQNNGPGRCAPTPELGWSEDLGSNPNRSKRQIMSAKEVTAIVGNEPNTAIARIGYADVLTL